MTNRYTISDRRSAGRVAEAVVDELGLAPGGLRDALRQAVREVAYNAADWAGAGEVALERAGSGAQIVVLDQGPGIHATMQDAFPGLTEEEVVLHATRPGVSSTGEQFRGFGLWSAVNVSAQGVRVVLETGGVTLLFRDGTDGAVLQEHEPLRRRDPAIPSAQRRLITTCCGCPLLGCGQVGCRR